jgi:hypothetical protein
MFGYLNLEIGYYLIIGAWSLVILKLFAAPHLIILLPFVLFRDSNIPERLPFWVGERWVFERPEWLCPDPSDHVR